MTTRSINERIREHINVIKKKDKSKNTYLYEHYNNDRHNHNNLTLQILYQSDITNEEESKADLLSKEHIWIKILNTAFPYGLNDSLKGYGNISESTNPIDNRYQPYFTMPVKRRIRSHGKRKRRICKTNDVNKKTQETEEFITNNHNDIRKCYILLRSLTKQVQQKLFHKSLETNQMTNYDLIILGFVAETFSKVKDAKPKNPYRWKIPFINRGIEEVKIETILKDKKLNNVLPAPIDKPISITYSYNFPNRAALCNYNKVLKNLNQNTLQEKLNNDCCCKEYTKYIYPHYGHVLTGDLNIIQNEQLRNTFKKGAKFRNEVTINWDKNDQIITESLDTLIQWLSNRNKKPLHDYVNYKNRFLSIYRSRKRQLIRNTSKDIKKEDTYSRQELKSIHNKFIITITDKASNNLVIICPKLYLSIICKELGIDTKTWKAIGNDTYSPTDEIVNNIIKRHSAINTKYGYAANTSESRLPSIYPIPKLHKNPYKFRFIAAAINSSMKPISILLDRILKHFKNHMKNYTNRVKKTTGINSWLSLNSTNEFVERIQNTKKPHTEQMKIVTGDFSSMFTALKQDTILTALYKLTDHCFQNAMNSSKSRYIHIAHNYINYTKTRTDNSLTFDKEEIKEIIETQVRNSYVTFANYTFKQTQGTSMGSNASCSIADCVMIWHEFEYLTKHCSKQAAKKLSESGRYVDDFYTTADMTETEIMEHIHKMYPKELTLEFTHTNRQKANFLDTTISIDNTGININVYNKTDDFPFKVIRYCCSGSMVHSSLGYKVFYGELFRFARICSHVEGFETKTIDTIKEFKNNNYLINRLIFSIMRFCSQNRKLIAKFGIHTRKDIIAFANRLA